MSDISETIEERGKRYGKFTGHASVSQGIQQVIKDGFEKNERTHFEDLDEDMQEALFMIAHKLGRIVNGDPWYADSWIDIAGYAKLVSDRLEENIER